MTKHVMAAVVLVLSAGAVAQPFDAAAERQMVEFTNQARAREGLPALKVDAKLTEAARRHTTLLAQHKELSHDFPGEPGMRQRFAATGLRFARAGENVALDSDGPEAAHIGLMHSPPHRANILHPDYNSIGIGAAWRDGVLYVTEDFAHVLATYSVDEMENAIAARLDHNAGAHPHDAKMRSAACELAQQQKLQARDLLRRFPQAHRAFAFSINDPSQVPENVRAMRSSDLGTYKMGACFAKSERDPEGMFWVALIFY